MLQHKSKINIIDLFSGVGGFSLGAHLAGFDVELAIDNDLVLTSSHCVNFPLVPLLQADIAQIEPLEILSKIGGGRPAGVIGGPPCQAFSEIGRSRRDDPRRNLLGHFYRIVLGLDPLFFVMENVRGLGFPTQRPLLENSLALVRDKYEIIGPLLLDSSEFGLPTRRRRLFVIGIDKRYLDPPPLCAPSHSTPTVKEAISDLEYAEPLAEDADGFDWWRYRELDKISEYALRARSKPPEGLGGAYLVGRFSGHRRTKHSAEVVKRFATIPPGSRDAVGKHRRLDWDGLCPALTAGTGFDRGRFQSVRPIHPSGTRVITVREAARLQGFPDWFMFHSAVWHSFRMIGNSVPPPLARTILVDFARQLAPARSGRRASP